MKILFLCSDDDINKPDNNLIINFLKLQKEEIFLLSNKITIDFVKNLIL